MASFEARNNLTSDQYQQTFDQLVAQGFRPTVVSGYSGGGPPLFAAIFVQTSGPPFQARINLTSDQYQQTFDQLVAQAFQPTLVSGFEVGGQPLFAAIFQQIGNLPFQARMNLTSDQYQQTFDQLVAQGFQPTFVNGYVVGGQPLFAAIFAQTGGPPFQARNNLTSDEYQQTFNQLVNQGFRPTVISGYSSGGPPLFAAIFQQNNGTPFEARINLTSDQYQQTFNQLVSQGFQPTLVNGYVVGGQPLFAAIFEQ
jgi:hypothetical protein